MKTKGPWSQAQIDEYFQTSQIPIRLGCNGGNGTPLLVSLWFTLLNGRLWCASQKNSRIVQKLRRDSRCAFEVSNENFPYKGVRGTGKANIIPELGKEFLERLIKRYLGSSNPALSTFLLSRSQHEVAIEIEPSTLMSWDFQNRMVSLNDK